MIPTHYNDLTPGEQAARSYLFLRNAYTRKPAPWLRPTGAWSRPQNTRRKRLKLLLQSVKRLLQRKDQT